MELFVTIEYRTYVLYQNVLTLIENTTDTSDRDLVYSFLQLVKPL